MSQPESPATTGRGARPRALLVPALKAIVSLLLLAALLSRVDLARLWSVARTASLTLLAGALLAASGSAGSPATAVALIALATVALTLGEIAGGAASWAVALSDVPPEAEGRYQSIFSMGASTARILGPGIALPLVLATGAVGWVILGVAMAGACLGIARLAGAQSRIGTRTPRSSATSTARS